MTGERTAGGERAAGGEPAQLVFDLAQRQALDAEDFFVSGSNAAAIGIVDGWPQWSHWAAVVSGPAGSGKSHLVNVWRSRSGAASVEARALNEAVVATFGTALAEAAGSTLNLGANPGVGQIGALAVENLERGVGDERALFHLLNLAREQKLSILLTSRVPPGELDVTLPDLRSRLRALPHVAIEPPDETLLGVILVKLFADRQLAVEPHVIAHLLRHMDRSTEMATGVVTEIDHLALATHRKVTRTLAAEALLRVQSRVGGHTGHDDTSGR
jgi:chromosomal replication initiation ATPase DnaA